MRELRHWITCCLRPRLTPRLRHMDMPPYARLAQDPLHAALPLWQAVLGVFLPSLIAFVALDAAWIGLVAKDFYNGHLAGILKPDVDVAAAALSWLCIVAINQFFVLPKTAGSKSPAHCLIQGGLLGLLLYGTVDLTNCALLKGWTWPVALVDMAWGTFGSATLALLQNRLHCTWVRAGLASTATD